MKNPVISVKNVCKTYDGVCAVNELSFDVFPSTCFGFLGPNGAGKTTMLKIIYGVGVRDKRSGDSVDVFGYDPGIRELDIKYLAGVVPQEDNLDQELNVLQNLFVYSKFYAMKKKEAIERIDFLLEFLELSNKRTARIRELSGGMKRRLVIARALIHAPKLLILDEPTTGLDPQVRHLIWEKLRALKAEGTTILLTTHYMEEAFQICDTIIIMDKGKKVLEGAPQQLLEQNVEKYVLQLQSKESVANIDTAYDKSMIRLDTNREPPAFFSQDMEVLKKLSQDLHSSEFYLRQSNLEDLFLKITGGTLNAQQ